MASDYLETMRSMLRNAAFFCCGLLSLLSIATSPVKVCAKTADCVLVDNPKCVDEFNKFPVHKKHRKQIARRRCKKTTYQFFDTDPGAVMSAECVAKECKVRYQKN